MGIVYQDYSKKPYAVEFEGDYDTVNDKFMVCATVYHDSLPHAYKRMRLHKSDSMEECCNAVWFFLQDTLPDVKIRLPDIVALKDAVRAELETSYIRLFGSV